MKIERTVFAQALRFVGMNESTFYVPEVIRIIKERYGFASVPETPQEMLPGGEGNPLVFNHGRLIHRTASGNDVPIVVRFLRLYRHAVAVEVNNDVTDQCDIILDDFLSWFPFVVRSSGERHYTSQLEVTFDFSLDMLTPVTLRIGASLDRTLSRYRKEDPSEWLAPHVPFQVAGLVMHSDPAKSFLTCDFRIERRASSPYDTNLYFSQAPLATNDHIAILQEFEDFVTAAS